MFTLSAFAYNVNVFIQDEKYVQELKESRILYERASSAKVNWSKSEASLVDGSTFGSNLGLSGSLRWEKRGIKVRIIGVYLGSETFQR